MTTRVAILGRVSTDRQEDSIVAQEERALRHCEAKGFAPPEHLRFYDTDVSGSMPIEQRPEGRKLMAVIESGQIDHLVVADLDRLSRDTRDGLDFAALLLEKGVALHIVDFGGNTLDFSTPEGEFILTVLLAKARYELRHIRRRTSNVMASRREAGKITGEIPYGWLPVLPDGSVAERLPDTTEWPAEARLVEHPEEVAVIRLAHSLRQQGWKDGRIATELNRRGIPTKKGSVWATGNLRSILDNRYTQDLLARPQ